MEQFLAILKTYWGYDSFREMQPEIITSVSSGHDTLGLMPTGGGKSLTFQVPALAMDGICLVVTPLIALMKDQVANLRRRGILAVALHSGLTRDEMTVALDNCLLGGGKFVYLSPERLATELFLVKVRQMKVCMIVVDEAHCISQWGYDFRPAYLNIADLRNELPGVPVLALTATATPRVVDDIMQRLRFSEPRVFRKSFARPNIAYIVRPTEQKEEQLIRILSKVPGSSVVYVRNRKQTREYAQLLAANGISAAYFHAGLPAAEKDRIQKAWTDNAVRVIVCTNAFGMGIDKPDVRTVVHMMAPDSLEAYFQEAGRAGRDGRKAYATLLWSKADEAKLRKSVADAFPPIEFITKVYQTIGNYYTVAVGSGCGMVHDFDIGRFCQECHLPIIAVNSSLAILGNAGYIDYQANVEMQSRMIFIIDNRELYTIQLQYPDLDITIKTVLRLYTGLFSEYVAIDEERIARRCGKTRQQIYEDLQALTRMRVARYMPARKTSQLTWLDDRQRPGDLIIRPEVYGQRRDDLSRRVESVIAYCTNDTDCRSRQLLDYFGERHADDCGHCDVCLK